MIKNKSLMAFYRLSFIIFLFISFIFFSSRLSFAQVSPTQVKNNEIEIPSEVPPTGINLTLSPTFISLITDPGKSVSTQFSVINNNSFTEYLEIGIAKFEASANGANPVIADVKDTDEFVKWVSFSESQFTVDAREKKTIKVTISPSSDAALGYYYALVIKRLQKNQEGNQQAVISGSPAIAVLLNVKSDNAKRELQLVDFTTDKMVYEELPVGFKVHVKNTGNIHAVPVGDIFIDSGNEKEIGVLQFNRGNGNVLPQTSRTYTAEWADGFIVRKPKVENEKVVLDDKGNPVFETSYDFSKANKFRFGKYTANLLLIYDDGERDVPIEATISFWVLPWKLLAIFGVIMLLVLVGVFSVIRNLLGFGKRK